MTTKITITVGTVMCETKRVAIVDLGSDGLPLATQFAAEGAVVERQIYGDHTVEVHEAQPYEVDGNASFP